MTTLDTSLEKAREEARKTLPSLAVIERICEKTLIIDESYRKAHDGQHFVVSYESAKVYSTKQEAEREFLALPDKEQQRTTMVEMCGGGFGEGYALIKNVEVRWFRSSGEAVGYIHSLSPERRETAVKELFTTVPYAF